MQTDMHWVYSPHIVRYEKMSDNFRRLKLSKCFQNWYFWGRILYEVCIRNSLLPTLYPLSVIVTLMQLYVNCLCMTLLSIKGPIFQRILIPFTSGILNNLDINISLISNCCFLNIYLQSNINVETAMIWRNFWIFFLFESLWVNHIRNAFQNITETLSKGKMKTKGKIMSFYIQCIHVYLFCSITILVH